MSLNLVSKIQNKLVREGSTLYVIGGNLYSGEKSYKGTLSVRCIHHKAKTKHCKARAHMDEHTLQVLKTIEVHTCEQDPNQKGQTFGSLSGRSTGSLRLMMSIWTPSAVDRFDDSCNSSPIRFKPCLVH